jgi:hypothetical protein
MDVRLNSRFEILTPSGWENFRGVASKGSAETVRIVLENGCDVRATLDHTFYVDGVPTAVRDLGINDCVDIDGGCSGIISICEEDVEEVFDLIEVENGHQFLVSNCIITKNCDEFAFVPPNKASEFWTSIQPVLSTGGACIITSTPKSDEDQFAQIYKGAMDNTDDHGNLNPGGRGKGDWFALTIPWDRHPERNEAWAKPFRESLGEARFAQEFCCDFVTDDETLINPLKLRRMTSKPPEFYTGTIRWYKDIEPNKTYMIALDPSLGYGGDNAAIEVFQLPEMIQVGEWQHNLSDTRTQVRRLMQTLLYIDAEMRDNPDQSGEPEIYWTVENNSIGEATLQIIEDTGEERFPGIFVTERKRKGQSRRFRKGFNTDNRKKLSACARLKSLVESDRMEIRSSPLIKELKSFVHKEASFGAKPGEHDDLTMATLLIVRMLDVVLNWGTDVGDLREYIGDDDIYETEPMPIAF